MKELQPPILLAEDNEEDIILIRRAWDKCGFPHRLVVTNDGYQAIDYLGGQPPYTDRRRFPLPGLLLLDIKMRLLDGFEVLVWLQTRPELRHLPAVMLSSSHAPNDLKRARELGAVEYFVKPMDPADLETILRTLHRRWLAGASNGHQGRFSSLTERKRAFVSPDEDLMLVKAV
jgi:CheY-like chemotaxis protein